MNVPCKIWKRAVNLIIDLLLLKVVVLILGLVVGIYTTFATDLFITFIYYFCFELILQKTPAKYLTKTKITTNERGKPTYFSIFIRSLVRFIPLDIFTFITSTPRGLHDRLSGTIVVDE